MKTSELCKRYNCIGGCRTCYNGIYKVDGIEKGRWLCEQYDYIVATQCREQGHILWTNETDNY